MRYFISQHQHKAIGIDNALRKEGWLPKHRWVDVALFDHDINKSNSEIARPIIQKYYDQKSTIITYPHGATGAWWTDSKHYLSDKFTFANLVIAEGHKHVQEITQPRLKHYIIGWSYCPIKEFEKHEIKKILFAPIHATLSDNKLREEALDINSRVYSSLLELPNNYQITVRHLNPLGAIGLYNSSRVKFVRGKPDGSYLDIDQSDLVIAEGTYMYLAVARGKPTIGMNQHIPIRSNHSNKIAKAENWELYGDYMAYPIDFDDGNLEDLIEKASIEEQSSWKKLFIGKEMDSKNLSDLLTNLRKEHLNKKEF